MTISFSRDTNFNKGIGYKVRFISYKINGCIRTKYVLKISFQDYRKKNIENYFKIFRKHKYLLKYKENYKCRVRKLRIPIRDLNLI